MRASRCAKSLEPNAEQFFLRPEWEQHIVPVLRPSTRWLRLFRPHTIDLILTKMMRGNDEQDMEDIRCLIEHDGITAAQMEPAFATVRMPDGMRTIITPM